MNYRKRDAPGPICISMKPSMAKRVMTVAKQRGQTRSAFIRDLVVKELGDGRQDGGQKA